MDLTFARSRRRAEARRARGRARPRGERTRRATLLGGVLFALIGGIAADAQTPAEKPLHERREAAVAGPCPVPKRFEKAFAAASRETGVPLSLLVAMAYEESQMNPNARSRAGAHGLLQLMPATARELALDARVPKDNILGGARYLRNMLDRFDGNLDLALAAYNAGPGAVEKAGAAPTLETLAYVENVKARSATLSSCR